MVYTKKKLFPFDKALSIGQKAEADVANILQDIYGYEIVSFNDDYKYDILCRNKEGKDVKIEVKEDFRTKDFNNVAVEFFCRKKPSGIDTSESDYYIFKIHTKRGVIEYWIIETAKLRSMIKFNQYKRVSNDGGDIGSGTKNYLFEFPIFMKFSKEIKVSLCLDYNPDSSNKCEFYFPTNRKKEGACIKAEHYICYYSLKYLNRQELNKEDSK